MHGNKLEQENNQRMRDNQFELLEELFGELEPEEAEMEMDLL